MPAERPFVDAPPGGREVTDPAARQAATRFGLPSPEYVRTGMNALYVAGDTVLRVSRPTAPAGAALRLAERLRAAGIDVVSPRSDAVVELDGLSVTAWERLVVVDAPPDWHRVGAMVRRLHGLPLEIVPDGYPVPSPIDFPWWDFDALLDDVSDLLDERARAALERTIGEHARWRELATDPTTLVLCHGDIHPGNVVATADGPVLIDWDLLCHAPPGWDHAMLLTLAGRWGGDPQVYRAFADGYGASFDDDPAATTFATLRNVAATLMRLRAGRSDGAARVEAERRLRYWRGDPAAPMWSAQ